MARGLVVVAAVFAALVVAVPARALEFHVVHRGSMSATQLRNAERAITFQVNHQVRPYWHNPTIRFGSAGVPVYFYSHRDESLYGCGPGVDGCHAPGGVWVENQPPGWFDATTVAFSHEIIEATVDPQDNRVLGGLLAEPCDGAEGAVYDIGHIMVANFVYPSWFRNGSRGPWDYMRADNHARALATWGAYDTPMSDPTARSRAQLLRTATSRSRQNQWLSWFAAP